MELQAVLCGTDDHLSYESSVVSRPQAAPPRLDLEHTVRLSGAL